VFKDVDICIFAHVGAQITWLGRQRGNGMGLGRDDFKGESAPRRRAVARPFGARRRGN